MRKIKPMFLFYFSITLAICSSALYHFVAKSTPSNVNFTISLLITHAVAYVVTVLGFFFFPATNGIVTEIKQLNWAGVGLATSFALPIANSGSTPDCYQLPPAELSGTEVHLRLVNKSDGPMDLYMGMYAPNDRRECFTFAFSSTITQSALIDKMRPSIL
jgi:hypothetical protein